MTVHWHQEYDGGRIVVRLGSVDVGAVFPGFPGTSVRWRFWGRGGAHAPEGRARSELAAKNALIGEIRAWLQAAGLVEEAGQ